jgi:hypothetical protein
MILTYTTWYDDVHAHTVIQLVDDQTPSGEKRFAKVLISDVELVRAFSPKMVFERYVTELVKMFNKVPGKKVKIVRTAEEMDEDRVPPIMLPYHIGLEYYDA